MSNETITITMQEYLDLQTTWKPEHTIFLILTIILGVCAIGLLTTLFLNHKEDK